MKIFFYLIKFAACLIFIVSCSAKEEDAQTSSDPSLIQEGIQKFSKKGYELTLSLPINAALAEDKLVHLIIKIPQGWKMIGGDEFMKEFMPSTDENPSNWSKLLTTQCFKGKGVNADHLVTMTKEGISSLATDVVILEEKEQENANYKESSLIMVYTTPNGRREIVMMKYFSGPYDCSGSQCAILLKKGQSGQGVLEELKDFFNKAVVLINP